MTMTLMGPRCELALEDAAYPDSLREVPRPPKRLYVLGDSGALERGLAVVGARRATPYGMGCARRFARIAAEKGIVVISGGARGCDSEAHRAALEAGGRTVAFLGGGCDKLYPPEHFSLCQRIVDAGGAVVSEVPWDCDPRPTMFRSRNRLIAGLAGAVLIVEAGLPSGTFSTADEALEAGRDVLVVPGAITSDTSRGANRLLYQGATPIVDDESFEEALFNVFCMLQRPDVRPGGVGQGGQTADPVVEAVLAEPLSIEDLLEVARSKLAAPDPYAALMERLAAAEAAGLVTRQPDGRWAPRVPG